MTLGTTLFIKNSIEAVQFYQEAFGMTLGYHVRFENGTFMHAELQKDGKTVFCVCDHNNEELVAHMRRQAENGISPVTSLGIDFRTEEEVRKAYEYLIKEGTICREIGELPWSKCSADVLDKYGVYWYIYV